jgi:hypothetical protein
MAYKHRYLFLGGEAIRIKFGYFAGKKCLRRSKLITMSI